MPTDTFTGDIPVPARRVFDYIADITHLPGYLPLMSGARSLDDDRVEIEAQVKGGVVLMAAWFRPDSEAMRIDWGSATEPGYHGWVQVRPAEGDPGSTRVEFELTTPRPHTLEPYFKAATQFVTTALTTPAP
ncbi:MAG TPA: hypothetical protein DHW34_02485 [Actinobacteria bacterium]|nr:hypothetical protein [Actinomycetota bacterium]